MARRKAGSIKLVHGVHPANIVPFGSDKHRAILGIDSVKDPGAKAALEEQLQTPVVMAEDKSPINRSEYRRGEEIFDGWVRQGR